MPPDSETPEGARRRARRPARKAAKPTVPTAHLQDGADPKTLSGPAKEANQPVQILRRGEPNVVPPSDGAPTTTLSPSVIPSKTHTTAEGNKSKHQMRKDSAPEAAQSRKNKSKTPQGKHMKASVAPTAATGASKPTPSTPGPNNTPSKAYAGPTFHASPAPSSLPLPKFFSKSVPNVDKTTSLKNMLDQESLKSSESEGSPLNGTPSPSRAFPMREESPLNIFFQADKDAKVSKPLSKADGSFIKGQKNFSDKLKGLNGNSLEPRVRNHIRHHTDSSAGGVFPFEMDTAVLSNQSQKEAELTSPSLSGQTLVSAVFESPNETNSELQKQQLKIQSLALKQLLHSPPSQGSTVPHTRPGPSSRNTSSPTPKPRPGNRASARLSGTPPQFPKGLETPPDQRRAALLALAEKQIASSNSHTSQRPPSSRLRKEMMVPSSPKSGYTPGMPSTPTPSRINLDQTSLDHSQSFGASDVSNSAKSAPVIVGNVGTDPDFAAYSSDSSVKLMEEDLRRILKLDAFTSDGVAGVRS